MLAEVNDGVERTNSSCGDDLPPNPTTNTSHPSTSHVTSNTGQEAEQISLLQSSGSSEYDMIEYCLTDVMSDQLLVSGEKSSCSRSRNQSSVTIDHLNASSSTSSSSVANALLYQYRPFACHFCSKRFKRKDHLVEHERTHTGEKPYVCFSCGKRFAKKTNLNTHSRSHQHQMHHKSENDNGLLDLKKINLQF